jgi:ATP-dependent Zn protease
LGYTEFNNSAALLHTSDQIFARMSVSLAGRCAERQFFKQLTTGDRDDLQKATRLAYLYVATYGFQGKTVSYNYFSSFRRIYSDEVASEIDQEVQSLVAKAFALAESTVNENVNAIKKVAEALLERDSLYSDDIAKMIGPPSSKSKNVGDLDLPEAKHPVIPVVDALNAVNETEA